MSDEPEQYTFEDVELYSHVVYMGNRGWIIDKGGHLIGSIENKRHLLVTFEESGRELKMHEDMVTRNLEDPDDLWIDMEQELFPTPDNA